MLIMYAFFSMLNYKLGCTDMVQPSVDTGSNLPIHQQYRVANIGREQSLTNGQFVMRVRPLDVIDSPQKDGSYKLLPSKLLHHSFS